MFKQLFIFAILTASAFCEDYPPVHSPPVSDDDESEFRNWMDRFNKKYDSESEYSHRLQIWKGNNGFIQEHNKKPDMTFTLGHNHLSDMTEDEIQAYYQIGKYSNFDPDTSFGTVDEGKANEVLNHIRSLSKTDIPAEVDWEAEGAITPVKDQGGCSSCYAFVVADTIASARYIKTGELTCLSPQQIVDCDRGSYGCNRGHRSSSYEYVEEHGGLCSWDDYPYREDDGMCKASNCDVVPDTAIEGYVQLSGDLDELLAAASIQPVAVGVSTWGLYWYFYRSGVMAEDVYDSEHCWPESDHAMVMTGYGTDEETGLGYIRLKNSWDDDWGDNGYMKISTRDLCRYGVRRILESNYYPVYRWE